jgi:hypothetical protein
MKIEKLLSTYLERKSRARKANTVPGLFELNAGASCPPWAGRGTASIPHTYLKIKEKS